MAFDSMTAEAMGKVGRKSQRLRVVQSSDDYPDVERPKTRGDCADMPRPCPFVSCRHHLYLEVDQPKMRRGGRVTRSEPAIYTCFPDREVWELSESCSLDVADRDGLTLEEVGRALGISKQRVQQIIDKAAYKLARKEAAKVLHATAQDDPLVRYGR
jgi:predicted DNA-binding protein (UPF0251 family)